MVDQFQISIWKKQKIIDIAVNMGNGLRTVQGIQMVHQRIHPVFYDFIVLKWDTTVFDAQIFIKCDPFPDIKGMLQLDSGLMELCHQIHALLHI